MKFKRFIEDKLLILDFGSKKISDLTNQLRHLKIFCEVHPFTMSLSDIKKFNPKGIILSGSSILKPVGEQSREPDKNIYGLKVPILGICYGAEMLTEQLGGKVEPGVPEIGIVELKFKPSKLFEGFKADIAAVWMHHEDQVTVLPTGFKLIASTQSTKHAAIEDVDRQIYGVQFHPEAYTSDGVQIIQNFVKICNCSPSSSQDFHDEFHSGHTIYK